MHDLYDDILADVSRFAPIPKPSLEAYRNNTPVMTKYVNEAMSAHSSVESLIGPAGLPLMIDNHSNHAAFMATVFSLSNYALLARTIPWVYRTYHAHGFSYDYFPVELNLWIDAIKSFIPADKCSPLVAVYEWMLANHDQMISLSRSNLDSFPQSESSYRDYQNKFLEGLLDGNHRSCLAIAKEVIGSTHDITPLYVNVIQPAMYEVGRRWEADQISVAEEHLASAIVGRVIASTDMLDFLGEQKNFKAIVTSAPNEYHEIGAWMVSDVIESQGWDVSYLGANTPSADLLDLANRVKPDLLAVSATMAFNIDSTREIIEGVRANESLSHTQVLVGGRIFNEVDGLWKSVGADYYAASVHHLRDVLQAMEMT
jgi:methanogenic corrinoid protein MtbC1